ncbi:hypothetical protein M409DRAFT_70362 [Zasmidium cellare ATCC 36951]|uniref:Dihydrodipicolinate synthase n=1 Tax=Zasmidium cellare ATCC 36951 TaxID=1080233 RepID=A0A6A6C0Q2_ZASCE|nr:uncharacterized protein M409DRAFT_70362 [Zasmidium cellare ATCC 36951]KAF2160624.1 hypothetical protein M409DRAFT_70362 [Zasmidium cellare ATCC 36951]
MPANPIKAPPQGVYVPAITLFDHKTDTLEPNAQAKYFKYLAQSGITGLVVLGTNAETFLLTKEERVSLICLARRSVPANFPIIAGVSGHSTAQVKAFIADAASAGADYALLLPCAYFGKQTTPSVVKSFFADVARTSPLPIIIYNFPAVCNGLDLDSELITSIAQASPKIVGVKLTCGSVAKITRLSATFSPERFAVFGGQVDFLYGGLAAGSSGCIGAFGNVYPHVLARIYELWQGGDFEGALSLQQKAALAESPTKAGIASTKLSAALFSCKRAGIRDATALALPRAPYDAPSSEARSRILEVMADVEVIEAELWRGRQGEDQGIRITARL